MPVVAGCEELLKTKAKQSRAPANRKGKHKINSTQEPTGGSSERHTNEGGGNRT